MKSNRILPVLATGFLTGPLLGAGESPWFDNGGAAAADGSSLVLDPISNEPRLTDLIDSDYNFRFAVETAGGASDADELAKKLANPIASMISVPFQHNFDFNAGPNGDGFQWKMNLQPVIPISLNEDWNLITRTIVPVVIYQEDVSGTKVNPSGSQSGLQDTTVSAWFSPKAPTRGGWIWGAGPILYLPTGTDSDSGLGTSQWGAGPTAIALRSQGQFTYGMLLNHVWGLDSASNGIPALSNTFVQPFFSYIPGGGWTYTVTAESTYNWQADDDELTVPINLLVSKMIKIGSVQTQWQFGARYYAVKQDNGPEWGLRLNITLLFPD